MTEILGDQPVLILPPATVIAFGDSITAGWGLAPGDCWVDRLNVRLGGNLIAPVVNSGISMICCWTPDGAGALTSVVSLRVAQGGPPPKHTLVAIGANDIPRYAIGGAPSLEQAFNGLRGIDTALGAWGVEGRHYLTILPACVGTLRTAEFLDLTEPRRAAWNTWLHQAFPGRVMDMTGVLGEDSYGRGRPEYYQDGLHLSALGAVRVADAIDVAELR